MQNSPAQLGAGEFFVKNTATKKLIQPKKQPEFLYYSVTNLEQSWQRYIKYFNVIWNEITFLSKIPLRWRSYESTKTWLCLLNFSLKISRHNKMHRANKL